MSFDFEEKAIITDLGIQSKEQCIAELEEAVKNTEDTDMIKFIEKTIVKVTDLSESEYSALLNDKV
ncbi:MAG: transposon-transfer assisting family protein [bacterium]|nr:transposon-transfer assisting family protein [bacterium]